MGAATQAFADAEIQIFMNYRGVDAYDYKYVSNWNNELYSQILEAPPYGPGGNAACYNATNDPNEAISLLQEMAKYPGGPMAVTGSAFWDFSKNDYSLQVYQQWPGQRPTVWFARLQRCVRWATPDELSH